MILAIDIGNSNVKFGVFNESELLYIKTSIFSEFELSINGIYRRFTEINQIAICDVANQFNKIKKVLLKKNLPLFQVNSSAKTGFNIKYLTPKTIGVDRLALVAGSIARFPNQSLLIIDAGTAITYDYVDNLNNYLGGNISPGITIRFRALSKFTESLPLVEKTENFSNIGQSTTEAIQSGVLLGTIIEIEGIISKFKQQNPHSTVILTGGDGKFLHKSIKSNIFVLPNIVLEGIYEIYKFNKIG